jgi:hypothetical protein
VAAALALLAVPAIVVPEPGRAAETVVSNDTLAAVADGVPCNCFAAGNRAAAWLSPPCRGDLVGVQVLWRSPGGGSSPATEQTIVVAGPAGFPVAGLALETRGGAPAVIEAPVLVDGEINELRFLDAARTQPLRVPVASGRLVVVALEFANATATPALPATLVYDTDGCAGGRNAIFGDGAWQDGCRHGLVGDLGIRALIECGARGSGTTAARLGGIAVGVVALLIAGVALVRRAGRRDPRGFAASSVSLERRGRYPERR